MSLYYDADQHADAKLKVVFLNRVACVLVLNNLMVVVSAPGTKYGQRY